MIEPPKTQQASWGRQLNWLNKILSKPPGKPVKAAIPPAKSLPQPAVADLQQLRQGLSAALSAEERHRQELALGAALAQAKQKPSADDAPGVHVASVSQATDRDTALAWLTDCASEENLVEIALHARLAEVRRAAAQRLSSAEALERVAEASRLRDKGVYRYCMATLRERQAAIENSVRSSALEAELLSLLANDPVPAGQLVELERQLGQLGSGAHGRCSELFAQFRARAQEQSRALQRLYLRQAEVQTLAAQIGQSLQEDQCAQFRVRLQTLAEVSAEWPAWLADHKDLLALRHSLGELEERLRHAEEDSQRLRQAEAFLALHGHGAPMTEETIAAWNALAKPENPQLQADLQVRWQVCLNHTMQLAQKEQKQQPEQKAPTPQTPPPVATSTIDRDALKKRLDELEAALEQGHLAVAIKIEAAIGLPEGGTSPGITSALAQRLGRARAQLLQLRGWARWGTDQARQQLILKAQQLVPGASDANSAGADVTALAAAIVALRAEWKRLDTHSAPNHALWERFDKIVERAYAPVAAHRAEQAAQRAAARQVKEAHCLEWENWFAQLNWEHADHQVIQTMRQDICSTWRAAPMADRREERILQKRFSALLAALDASISEARGREVARREALIEAAEALRGEPSLRRAIDGVKALQQRWRDEAGSVKLGRAEQEQLWKKFRNVCDAIFARRAEEKDQQAAQRAERAEQEKQRQAELALQAQQRRTPFELMARKAALAEQIEQAAAAGLPVDDLRQQAEASWRELPRLPGKFDQALARRLTDAPGATADALAAGRTLRDDLLLDMEIALGLDSPQAQDASRRARQFELLQQKFRKSSASQADVEQLILTWYATAAAPDALQEQRMAAIVRMRLAESDRIRKA